MFDISNATAVTAVAFSPLSNHRCLAGLGKVAPHGDAGLPREFYEHPASVMRVGAPDEQAAVGHILQPAERSRSGDRRGNAEAGYRNPKLCDLGLQKIEKHVPGGVSEKILREEAAAQ